MNGFTIIPSQISKKSLHGSGSFLDLVLIQQLARYGLNPIEWFIDWKCANRFRQTPGSELELIEGLWVVHREDREIRLRGMVLSRLQAHGFSADWIDLELVAAEDHLDITHRPDQR